MKDVAADQTESCLEIRGSEHLTMLDRAGNVGRVTRQDGHDRIGGGIALFLRPAVAPVVRKVLGEHCEDVLTGRRQRRVRRRLQKTFDQRLPALAAGLRVLVRLLQVIDGRRDVDRGVVVRLRIGSRAAGEVRKLAEREIQLQRGTDAAPRCELVEERAARGGSAEQIEERRSRMRV